VTLYVVGPGFGESQVLVLPDERVVVVDACPGTLPLLRELDLRAIDLLVVTHTDLDHVSGMPELLEAFTPRLTWRPPWEADLRVLAARAQADDDGRLLALRATLDLLGALEDTNICVVPGILQRWPFQAAPYVLTCLGPSTHDQVKARAAIEAVVVGLHDGAAKAPDRVRDFLSGAASSPGAARPNVLSLALSLSWGDARLLLCGDLENGDGSPYSGWRGILRVLEREHQLDLVRSVHAVKVAHHGSSGAWSEEAWALHAEGRRPFALVAPFLRGQRPLPTAAVLANLRSCAAQLGITKTTPTSARDALRGGWKNRPTARYGFGPVLTLTLDAHGRARLYAGREGRAYT